MYGTGEILLELLIKINSELVILGHFLNNYFRGNETSKNYIEKTLKRCELKFTSLYFKFRLKKRMENKIRETLALISKFILDLKLIR